VSSPAPSDERINPEEGGWVDFQGSSYFDNNNNNKKTLRVKTQKTSRSTTTPSSSYYASGHQEAVECIYGTPKTPQKSARNKPAAGVPKNTKAVYLNSQVSSPNTPPRTPGQQQQQYSPKSSLGSCHTINSDTSSSSKEGGFEDDWVGRDKKSACINGKCLAMTACLLLSVILFFFLSLTIGTILRGEELTFNNILFGSPDTTPSPTVSFAPSASPTWSPTNGPTRPSNLTVAAYYYPWHGNDFHGRKYLREKIGQQPALGEYDDRLATTIAQHLYWSRYANVQVWITSWWGPGRREDDTILNHILPHKDLENHRIALLYETTGRIKASENYTAHRIIHDIDYICETYLDHPNYYRIDGRPVLFLYLTRKLEAVGKMEEVVLLMRATADNWGYDLYLIGDHVWQQPPSLEEDEEIFRPFLYLDAMTNYDVYGSTTDKDGMYAGRDAVTNYYLQQKEWKRQAKLQSNCGYIPAVSPGYNDRAVRPEADHLPLSRKLDANSPPGSLFEEALTQAMPLVDSELDNLLIVNSFNEWHEDTQIEPVVLRTDGASGSADDYTMGLKYEAYGERYLTMLRDMTSYEAPEEEVTTSMGRSSVP